MNESTTIGAFESRLLAELQHEIRITPSIAPAARHRSRPARLVALAAAAAVVAGVGVGVAVSRTGEASAYTVVPRGSGLAVTINRPLSAFEAAALQNRLAHVAADGDIVVRCDKRKLASLLPDLKAGLTVAQAREPVSTKPPAPAASPGSASNRAKAGVRPEVLAALAACGVLIGS